MHQTKIKIQEMSFYAPCDNVILRLFLIAFLETFCNSELDI